MKALVVYDSSFGNTEQLARAIALQLAPDASTTVLQASDANAEDLAGIDLLAVGGPTQAHGLSPALKAFLQRTPPEAVRDLPTVTFDTRLHGPRLLTGSAAASSAKQLERKGARLLVPPETFVVASKSGPLEEGELTRATTWACSVRDSLEAAPLHGTEPATPQGG